MKKIIKMIRVVAGVILSEDQKIFIAQRPFHKSQGGLWEFPGGKVEKEESNESSLIRELNEELSITVELMDFIHVHQHQYSTHEIELFAYSVKIIEGEIKLNEHLESKWVSLRELENYDLAPADIPIIEKLKLILNSNETY